MPRCGGEACSPGSLCWPRPGLAACCREHPRPLAEDPARGQVIIKPIFYAFSSFLFSFLFRTLPSKSRQSVKFFLQSSELGLPHPSPADECVAPPSVPGEGHTRLRERGWESPNSDEGHTLYIYVLCAYPFLTCQP